jgi:hypothetical protein
MNDLTIDLQEREDIETAREMTEDFGADRPVGCRYAAWNVKKQTR